MNDREALKHIKATIGAFGPDEGIELDQKAWSKLHSAIKEALAQPEHEPVAWGVPNTRPTEKAQFMMLLHSPDGCQYPKQLVPLYTTPPQRKPLTSSINDEMLAALEWITTYIENAPQHLTEAHQWAKISRGIIEAAHGIKE